MERTVTGLQAEIGRAKREIFKSVKAKVESRLTRWKSMPVSKPGREVMIKVVAQSIPTYCMSIGILPIMSRIGSRVEGTDRTCPCCLSTEKTEIHILRDCAYTRKVWSMVGVNIIKTARRGDDLVEAMAKSRDAQDFVFFLCLCWKTWCRRNEWTFEHTFKEDSALIASTIGLMAKLHKEKLPKASPNQVSHPPGWASRVKLNSDASVKQGSGTGLGFVIRAFSEFSFKFCRRESNVFAHEISRVDPWLYGVRV
ncbi:hypothetical protein V2J09_000070 [Rumex salicifolius]